MCRSRFFPLFIAAFAAGLAVISCGDDDKPVRADTTPPEVTLLSPADGLEIPAPRSMQFQARAGDNTGVARVDFYFDGELIGSDSSAVAGDSSSALDLYDYLWQTAVIPAGHHAAKARAVDAAGNSSEDAAAVNITGR